MGSAIAVRRQERLGERLSHTPILWNDLGTKKSPDHSVIEVGSLNPLQNLSQNLSTAPIMHNFNDIAGQRLFKFFILKKKSRSFYWWHVRFVLLCSSRNGHVGGASSQDVGWKNRLLDHLISGQVSLNATQS